MPADISGLWSLIRRALLNSNLLGLIKWNAVLSSTFLPARIMLSSTQGMQFSLERQAGSREIHSRCESSAPQHWQQNLKLHPTGTEPSLCPSESWGEHRNLGTAQKSGNSMFSLTPTHTHWGWTLTATTPKNSQVFLAIFYSSHINNASTADSPGKKSYWTW